jgi:hypothetical protein
MNKNILERVNDSLKEINKKIQLGDKFGKLRNFSRTARYTILEQKLDSLSAKYEVLVLCRNYIY